MKLTLRFTEENKWVHTTLKKEAKEDNRSLNNLIETILVKYFTDKKKKK